MSDRSVDEVRARLSEAEETLRAIRNGEVDALVVRDDAPAQVFTLSSADRPYRVFVESMRDGAATVSEAGIVLYANRRLSELLGCPLQQIIGAPIASFIAPADREALRAVGASPGGSLEAELLCTGETRIPVRVNSSTLDVDHQNLGCLTFADLTEQNAQRREIDRLGVAQAERMRELEQTQAALTRQATHDPLTGLPNRGLLIDRVTQTLALSQRTRSSTGLVFVDLDGFKQINDTQGHAAGDTVLCEVAARLRSAVRPMDSVARLGGDEFVVLLPGLDGPGDATMVAHRIAGELGRPVALDHAEVGVPASIGISVTGPDASAHDRSPDALLHQADTAMYHAKSVGGCRIKLFVPGSTPTTLEADRQTWAARIRDALTNDRFVLHAQPIVELAGGTVVQHELLLRMRSQDEKLIAPLDFLPTAERCGLVGEIDRWVIGRAAAFAASGSRVAVNLSAASAGDPDLLEQIERQMNEHRADPGDLVFEITETAVMEDLERGRRFAERLVALGCHFALDDFGTGFASFTYLKRLPVEYLKIDIEFVRELATSARDRSVVSAIVALAGGFGQQTIAEGVEDQATAAILRELGVTHAQGYLFGRPGPVSDVQRSAARPVPARS